jgi:Flp pilus assembly pilin Flp
MRRFADTSGATLVEYGVALLIVIIVGAGSITALGSVVSETLSDTASAF